MKKTDTPEIWTQQKGEQSKSFNLFTVYRDLGPYRTLEKVRQKQTKADKDHVPPLSTLTTLSAKWNWVERCKAWDDHLDEVARTEQELKTKNMANRHANDAEFMQAEVVGSYEDEDYEKLTPTQKAWIRNSNAHTYVKLALLERVSRGASLDDGEERSSGLDDFAETLRNSLPPPEEEEEVYE